MSEVTSMIPLSIVIPSYNDLDVLWDCLRSISTNTVFKYEVIIINNGSDEDGPRPAPLGNYPTTYILDHLDIEGCVKKTVIHWKENKWCNAAWNEGVSRAEGTFIAVLNSDITVPTDWDLKLIEALDDCTIACPYQTTPIHKDPIGLLPVFEKHAPAMIQGPCFMFKKRDVSRLFPIEGFVHWYGDRLLADRANVMDGVTLVPEVVIHHKTTVSGGRVDPEEYKRIIRQDARNYQDLTGQDESWVFPDL